MAIESLEGRTLLSAGQVDTTFGNGGVVALSAKIVGTPVMQPDGKILAIGEAAPASPLFLERLNPDGSLDTSFGTGGTVSGVYGSIALQADGKIVVNDQHNASAPLQVLLRRFNVNGTPDTTFGTNGQATTSLPLSGGLGAAVVIGANGKIIVSGIATYQDAAHAADSNYAAAVIAAARFNANGSLDTTFNGAGYTYQQLTSARFSYAGNGFAMTVQPDGKVLLGAEINDDAALWRFNVNGSLDTSFGNGGRAWIPEPFDDLNDDYISSSINGIIVEPNGKILCSGASDAGGADHNWSIFQFNTDGTPDTTFGPAHTGEAGSPLNPPMYEPGSVQVYPSMVRQPNGKIILSGINPASQQLAAIRFNADGSLDSSFTDPEFGNNQFPPSSAPVMLLPSGQPLLVAPGSELVRLQNDSVTGAPPASTTPTAPPSAPGNLGAGFGVLGRAFTNDPTSVWLPNSPERTVKATAVQADGKVIIAGSAGTVATAGIGQIFVERLNANGSVDTSFGSNGFVTTAFGPDSFATKVLIQSDGKILIGGATEDNATAPTDQTFALVRYNTNGLLDTSFGVGGKLTTNFAGNEQIDSLALYANGDIVAAGSYFLYPNAGFHIARYSSTGALETAFGTSGTVTVDLGPAPAHGEMTALTLQADGKLLIGTHAGDHPAIMRYNQDGTIDTTFGVAGVSLITAAESSGATGGAVCTIAVLGSGQILAAVSDVSNFFNDSQYIVRLSASGQIDTSFGSTGAPFAGLSNINTGITVPAGPGVPGTYNVLGLYPLQDGSILIATEYVVWDNMRTPLGFKPAVIKLLANGQVDSSFKGTGGINGDVDPHLISEPYFRGEIPRAAAIAPDGSLFMAFDAYADAAPSSPHWMAVTKTIGGAAAVIPSVPASTLSSTTTTPPTNNPPPPTTDPTAPTDPTTPSDPSNPTNPSDPTSGGGTPIVNLPDGQLTCTVVSATPAKALAGAKGVMIVKIKNTGAAWSGPVTINVYASTDSTLDILDKRLANLNIAKFSLKAGKTTNVRVPFIFSTDLSTAKYTLLASITESNAGTAAYTAAAKRAVALTAATVDLSVSFNTKKLVKLKSGKATHLTLLVKNIGNIKASGTLVVMLSGSALGVLGESLAGANGSALSLAPRATKRVTLTVTPPADLGSTFNLTALISTASSPVDANAANDTATLSVQVD